MGGIRSPALSRPAQPPHPRPGAGGASLREAPETHHRENLSLVNSIIFCKN